MSELASGLYKRLIPNLVGRHEKLPLKWLSLLSMLNFVHFCNYTWLFVGVGVGYGGLYDVSKTRQIRHARL